MLPSFSQCLFGLNPSCQWLKRRPCWGSWLSTGVISFRGGRILLLSGLLLGFNVNTGDVYALILLKYMAMRYERPQWPIGKLSCFLLMDFFVMKPAPNSLNSPLALEDQKVM